MKKLISIFFVIAVVWSVLGMITACDKTDGKLKPEISFSSEWQDNEFTKAVPELKAGRISSSTNFRGADRYYISIEDITIDESIAYVKDVETFGYNITKKDEDDDFISYTLYNKAKDANVYINIPKGKDSKGNDRCQMGVTIRLKVSE